MKGTKSKLFQRLDLIQKLNGGYIPDTAFTEIFESNPSYITTMDNKRGFKSYPNNMCKRCLNNTNGNCTRYCKVFYRRTHGTFGWFKSSVHICKNYLNRKKYWETIDKAKKV